MNRFDFFNNGRCGNEEAYGNCNQDKSYCREKDDCSCNTNCEQGPMGPQGPAGETGPVGP